VISRVVVFSAEAAKANMIPKKKRTATTIMPRIVLAFTIKLIEFRLI
jgi:hypothetical protein